MTVDLSTFTLNDQDSWFCEPFSLVDRQGKTWNVATNRAWWVAFRGKGKHPRWKGEGTELGIMLKLLHTPPEDPLTIKVGTLVGWIEGLAPKKKGVVLDVVVSLDKLKKVIGSSPKQTIKMWVSEKAVGDARSLGFEATGWRAVLMGLELDAAGLAAFKPPPASSKEQGPQEVASGFALAMSLGDDDITTDPEAKP